MTNYDALHSKRYVGQIHVGGEREDEVWSDVESIYLVKKKFGWYIHRMVNMIYVELTWKWTHVKVADVIKYEITCSKTGFKWAWKQI